MFINIHLDEPQRNVPLLDIDLDTSPPLSS